MSNEALVLAFPGSFPEFVLGDFERELVANGVSVQFVRTDEPVYASIEWAVPSIVAAYLAKPYLETLLKKAAEDSYPVIRRAFTKLLRSLFGVDYHSRKQAISSLVSLSFEGRHGYWVKALIWEGIPDDVQEEALDKLFGLIARHYESGAQPADFELPTDSGPPVRWGRLFVRFDLEKRKWEVVDILAASAAHLRKDQAQADGSNENMPQM